MPIPPEKPYTFEKFIEIIKSLRGPDGCPWDLEQNHQSLSKYAIEEAYELADAISKNAVQSIKDELGDLLLQVVLHSQIASEENNFNISDVISSISEKMIRRHPHVFSDLKLQSSEEVKANWKMIKSQERSNTVNESPMNTLSSGMSSLGLAFKIGEKAKEVNFDWADKEEVLLKVEEEFNELKFALKNESLEKQEEELGDLMFSIVQLSRHLKTDGESCLRKANLKFLKRFNQMWNISIERNLTWQKLSDSELNDLWLEAKLSTKN